MSEIPKTYSGPGLVDIQINGYAGFDFNGPAADWSADVLHAIVAKTARRGIAVMLPTLITDAAEAMIARAKRYAELVAADAQLAAVFPRLHIEGPFISPAQGPRGAHSQQHCTTPQSHPDLIDRLLDAAGGRIALVTLAPELPGAIELIARLAGLGICPAIGHTQASNAQLAEAAAAGAKLSTHLGNGSHQMLPRLDNYVQTQLADDRLFASFIGDGHHVPLTTLKNFIRAKTPQRSILISDVISAADCPPGEHLLAGMTVMAAANGRCQKPGEENLAGTAVTLDRSVIRVASQSDVSFERAWAMASTQPAQLLGLEVPAEVSVEICEDGFAIV